MNFTSWFPCFLCLALVAWSIAAQNRFCDASEKHCLQEEAGHHALVSGKQLLQVTSGSKSGVVKILELGAVSTPAPGVVEEMISLAEASLGEDMAKPSAQAQAIKEFNATLEKITLKNIRDGHALDQKQMDNLTGILEICSDLFDKAKAKAKSLAADVTSKRKAHLACRAKQVALETANLTATTNLFSFLEQQKKAISNYTKLPPYSVNDLATMANFWSTSATWFQLGLKTFSKLNGTYTAASTALKDAQKGCNKKQADFETSDCMWFTAASDAVESYEACWPKANQTFFATRDLVLEQAEHRKTEYKSVRKIQCILKHLGAAAHNNRAKIKRATSSLKACKHLDPSTDFLNVTIKKTKAAEKKNTTSIGDLSLKPGDSNWHAREYPSKYAKMLQPVINCNASVRSNPVVNSVWEISSLSTSDCKWTRSYTHTGDDGGMLWYSASSDKVYYEGDRAIVGADLTKAGGWGTVSKVGSTKRLVYHGPEHLDSVHADLQTGQMYQLVYQVPQRLRSAAGGKKWWPLGANPRTMKSTSESNRLSQIRCLDSNLKTQSTVSVSPSIDIHTYYRVFIGIGVMAVIDKHNVWWLINLACSGTLTPVRLGAAGKINAAKDMWPCERARAGGVLEKSSEGNFSIVYHSTSVRRRGGVQRVQIPSGASTVMAQDPRGLLGDMCSFSVDLKRQRWYWHREGGRDPNGKSYAEPLISCSASLKVGR